MRIRKPIVAPKFLGLLSKIQGFNVGGFFFFPFIFVNRPKPKIHDLDYPRWMQIVNHESIHFYQFIEMWGVGFLLLYLLEYIYGLYIWD